MRLAVDASRVNLARMTGTEIYSRDLTAALCRRAAEHQVTLYCRDPLPETFAPAASRRVIGPRRLWTHIGLSASMARDRPDALFVPAHVIPLIHPAAAVVTIHDLGYLVHRGAYRPGDWVYLLLSSLWNARSGRRFLVDSRATARDARIHLGIPREKLAVAYPGVHPAFRPGPPEEPPFGLEPGYLLFVGTLQPRKNLHRLVRAYATASRTTPMPPLVLAGAAGHRKERLDAEIARLQLVGRVLTPGYVADRDLPALYRGARALLFVSLYEGFGIPAAEAMACGLPVIASDRGALAEVVADAGLLVSPTDEDAIAAAMVRVQEDVALRDRMRADGLRQAQRFSWDAAAAVCLATIEAALSDA